MKEDYIYPVILQKEEDCYLVTYPNFPEEMTQEDTEEKAIVEAQKVLALRIIHNEDSKQKNPEPKKQEEIELEEGCKLVYVHVWMPYFRHIQKAVYVKKTLTIPKWLDEMAKKQDVNFSAILVKGLKQELGMEDR